MAAFGPRNHASAIIQSRKNGKLNLQGYGLHEIPEEVMDPFGNLETTELPQYVSMVTRANLQDNEISELPEKIGGIGGALELLELKNNKIKEFSESLNQLVGLKRLDVSDNEISVVSPLLNLKLLVQLNLNRNRLEALPDLFFRGLPSLNSLTIAENLLTTLPSLSGAPRLRMLSVQKNKITVLNVRDALTLECLVASYNTIENIVGLETLTALQTLDVAHNQLSSWPPVPINAPISCINLSFNAAIDMIPGETLMALRKTLKEILISNCALKELPPEVGALGKLRTLNVRRENLLFRIPYFNLLSSLFSIPQIEYNNLNDIPGSLGHLTELSALVVAGNLIRRKRIEPGSTTSEMKKYLATKDNPHPALIDDLTGGKDLASAALDRQLRDAVHYGTLTLAAKKKDKTKNNGVQENILAEFPVAILEERVAGELTELIVTGHGLVTLPTEKVPNLRRIVHLDLSDNSLGNKGRTSSAMDPPLFSALLKLQHLRYLHMKNCRIDDNDLLPLQHQSNTQGWPKLEELDLANNHLSMLPVDTLLMRTKELQILVLRQNAMAGDIPDSINLLFFLPKLRVVDFSSNKLEGFGQFRKQYFLPCNIRSIVRTNILHCFQVS